MMKEENKISKKKRWLYSGLTTVILLCLLSIGVGIVYRLTHEPIKGDFFTSFMVMLSGILILAISMVLYSVHKKNPEQR